MKVISIQLFLDGKLGHCYSGTSDHLMLMQHSQLDEHEYNNIMNDRCFFLSLWVKRSKFSSLDHKSTKTQMVM